MRPESRISSSASWIVRPDSEFILQDSRLFRGKGSVLGGVLEPEAAPLLQPKPPGPTGRIILRAAVESASGLLACLFTKDSHKVTKCGQEKVLDVTEHTAGVVSKGLQAQAWVRTLGAFTGVNFQGPLLKSTHTDRHTDRGMGRNPPPQASPFHYSIIRSLFYPRLANGR